LPHVKLSTLNEVDVAELLPLFADVLMPVQLFSFSLVVQQLGQGSFGPTLEKGNFLKELKIFSQLSL